MKEVKRLLEKARSNRAKLDALRHKGERGRLRYIATVFGVAQILVMILVAIVIAGCEAPQQQAQRQDGVKNEVAKVVVAYPDLMTGTPYQASGAVPLAKIYNGVPTETLVKDGFFRVLNAARRGADDVWYEVMVSNGSTDYHMWINASDLNGMTVSSYKSEEQQWQKQKTEQERAWKQYADQQQQQEKAAIRDADRQREAELIRQRMEYQAQREAQVAEAQNYQAMQVWQAQQIMQQQIADINGQIQSSQRAQNAQMEQIQRAQKDRENAAVQIQGLEKSQRESLKKGYGDGSIQQKQIDQLKSRCKLP